MQRSGSKSVNWSNQVRSLQKSVFLTGPGGREDCERRATLESGDSAQFPPLRDLLRKAVSTTEKTVQWQLPDPADDQPMSYIEVSQSTIECGVQRIRKQRRVVTESRLIVNCLGQSVGTA